MIATRATKLGAGFVHTSFLAMTTYPITPISRALRYSSRSAKCSSHIADVVSFNDKFHNRSLSGKSTGPDVHLRTKEKQND